MGQYDEALHQIEGYRKRLWDPEKKLLAHIWDDGAKAENRKEFWGGGNGWAAAGLARVIRLLPDNRTEDRQRLITFATDLIDGCLAPQRPDGLFQDVVDRPETFLETNLAQMLAYAIYTGLSSAWLPQRYRAPADRMRSAPHGGRWIASDSCSTFAGLPVSIGQEHPPRHRHSPS